MSAAPAPSADRGLPGSVGGSTTAAQNRAHRADRGRGGRRGSRRAGRCRASARAARTRSIVDREHVHVFNVILFGFGVLDDRVREPVAGRALPRHPRREHRRSGRSRRSARSARSTGSPRSSRRTRRSCATASTARVPIERRSSSATSCASTAGDQVVADGTLVSARRARARRGEPDRRVASRCVRGPGEPVFSGSFAVEGAGALRGDGGRRRQPRGPAHGDGARVPPPALPARAGDGPAADLARRARGPARASRSASRSAIRDDSAGAGGGDADGGDREHRARGADPARSG